MILSKQVL